MLTAELAIELTRLRIEEVNQRATLVSRLGELPAASALFGFRRSVVPLPAPVEVRQAPRQGDRQRIQRRLGELRRG